MTASTAKNNVKGVAMMVVSMAAFTLTDMFMKRASTVMPVGQILMILGAAGGMFFSIICSLKGLSVFSKDFFLRPVMMRNMAEIVGSICYVTALSKIDLSTASAILQATPLAVTFGAILFLKEKVLWHRWAAIIIGFIGVLIIIRPASAAFDYNALWAVAGMIFLSVRDLSTRAIPNTVSTFKIATYAMLSLFPAGFLFVILGIGGQSQPVDIYGASVLAGAIVTAIFGFWTITVAMRTGAVSFVAPFRYSRILFALAIGFVVFNEYPDIWTVFGAFLTIAAGLYAFSLENLDN